jgi:hypothetical protein
MRVEQMEDAELTRRELLFGAGKCALGAAGITALAAVVPGMVSEAHAVGGMTEKWPWPYQKLDPAATAEIAYKEWYRVFCGSAVVSAVFGQLREKVGEPYKSFPIDGFMFLEGGTSGWGTICGANAGANIVTNLIIGPRISGNDDGMLMGSEILQWYTETAFPRFEPKEPKFKGKLPQTVSNSPLCHLSVGKWMKAANKELGSPERKDRCARLTADVTAQLVTHLNAWKDGKYKTKGVIPAAGYGIQTQNNCNDCHGSKVPSPPKAKKA